MNFKKELLDRIRDKIDIVEYVGQHVDLVKRGDSYVGACPFHNDTNPSMRVHPTRKIFKCFGCGEGGSVITFAMKYHEISFPEAVEMLAALVGIPLPEAGDSLHIAKMMKYLDDMKNAFVAARKGNSALIDSLLAFETGLLDKFEVGLAPRNMVVFERDISWELGMITDQGWPYFYDRIIFPLKNMSGQVVGFYGRSTKEEGIKHLISKNSRIFKKSNVLFGMSEAKPYIKEFKSCCLVEGPKDVMAFHAYGVKNVVATCGTALTEKQARMIANSANQVYLAYDNDEGGIKAAIKNTGALLEAGLAVGFIVLPPGQDPYDCYTSGHELNLDSISLATFLTTLYPVDTPNDKLNYSKALISILEHSKNNIINHAIIERAAVVLNIPSSIIWEQFAQRPFRLDLHNIGGGKVAITEHWHQLTLGLSYAPQYAKDICSFLEAQPGDYSRALEVIKMMVDSNVQNQAQWMDIVASTHMHIPTHDDTLDLMSDDEIIEYIEVAARTLAGSNLMDLLRRAIALGDSEGVERIKQCMTSLQSTHILGGSKEIISS